MRMESREAAIELPFGSYLLRNEFGEIRISVYPEGEEVSSQRTHLAGDRVALVV